MGGEKEGVGEPVAPEGFGPVCHCARAICPVTDPWTQSLQVNCDSLLCDRASARVFARARLVRGAGGVHQYICILSPSMPVAVTLHLPMQNADVLA